PSAVVYSRQASALVVLMNPSTTGGCAQALAVQAQASAASASRARWRMQPGKCAVVRIFLSISDGYLTQFIADHAIEDARMMLTLEVIGPQAQKLAGAGRKVFNACGGTIGRLPDNDWVLPDPYISGRHASIRYRDGQYFIEDTSTNGVFINSPQQRLSRSMPQLLHDGDLIYIDAYCIEVSLHTDSRAPSSPARGKARKSSARILPPPSAVRDEHTANLPVGSPDAGQGAWGEASF